MQKTKQNKTKKKTILKCCCCLFVCLLEPLIYNKMFQVFEFFTENELIPHNQSGFKPGDSCINQLLCVTHDIYQSLDDGLETKSILLDM